MKNKSFAMLAAGMFTLLTACTNVVYEKVDLPTDFHTYGPDYQFRILNLEEKASHTILNEASEEVVLTAGEKEMYVVLSVEIERMTAETQSTDYALSKIGMTLKHHTGSKPVGNYQPVEDYNWVGTIMTIGETKDISVAFLVDENHGITKKALFFEFDILITEQDIDVPLNKVKK